MNFRRVTLPVGLSHKVPQWEILAWIFSIIGLQAVEGGGPEQMGTPRYLKNSISLYTRNLGNLQWLPSLYA